MEDVHLEGEGGIPEGVLRPAIVHRAPVEMLQTDRAGVGSILDKVAKDTEDTSILYLYLYLRYIFWQPVSYQNLQILGCAKDKIFICIFSGIPTGSVGG